MTYCVGLCLQDGLVMLADSRTNAGVDNIATYRKTFLWGNPKERSIVLMAAGNLAVTQSVISMLDEGLKPAKKGGKPETLLAVPSMFAAARLVGRCLREVYRLDGESMKQHDAQFSASFLLGGQIKGRVLRLFQIYTAGNFIYATQETPFLQIGEHKYGKPILDRAANFKNTRLEDGAKLCLISMDSTIRSNLSVGFPLDLVMLRRDSQMPEQHHLAEEDPYFRALSSSWSEALRSAYLSLPEPYWQTPRKTSKKRK